MTIHSKITPDQFREFALFDIFSHQKRWRGPLLFAAILTFSAAIAFSRMETTRGAGLLGGVLLAVGLGLPLVYFGNFFLSVKNRSRMFTGTVTAYTVELEETGVTVTKEGQRAEYPWSSLQGAYRLNTLIVLYVDFHHAFLLTGDLDREWSLLTAHLPPAVCSDKR